jgi:hypothetical protein
VVAIAHAAAPGFTAPRAALDYAGALFHTLHDVDAAELVVTGGPTSSPTARPLPRPAQRPPPQPPPQPVVARTRRGWLK